MSFEGGPLLTSQELAAPCIDFVRLQEDVAAIRRDIASLAESGPLDGGSFQQRLYAVASSYTEATAQFPTAGAERNLAQMLAWVRQARIAVCPEYRDPHRGTDQALFHTFVESSVIFVILLEDIGETLQHPGLQPLRMVVDTIGRARVEHPGSLELTTIDGFSALPPPEQGYAKAFNDACTLLTDFETEFSNRRQGVGVKAIRERMHLALAEHVDMIQFSHDFDRLVKGETPEIETEILSNHKKVTLSLEGLLARKEYIRQNQSNIFMRYMFLANFLQHQGRSEASVQRQEEFPHLLNEVDTLALGIEAIGNLGNDIATFFRELHEGFVGNSILADGLHRRIIEPQDVTETFAELKAPETRELTLALAGSIFDGSYPEHRNRWPQRFPNQNATLRLTEDLYQGGVFHDAMTEWNQRYQRLQQRFQASKVGELIDLDDFWQKQRLFFLQHLTAYQLI